MRFFRASAWLLTQFLNGQRLELLLLLLFMLINGSGGVGGGGGVAVQRRLLSQCKCNDNGGKSTAHEKHWISRWT